MRRLASVLKRLNLTQRGLFRVSFSAKLEHLMNPMGRTVDNRTNSRQRNTMSWSGCCCVAFEPNLD